MSACRVCACPDFEWDSDDALYDVAYCTCGHSDDQHGEPEGDE